jgi:hypothetical protein
MGESILWVSFGTNYRVPVIECYVHLGLVLNFPLSIYGLR